VVHGAGTLVDIASSVNQLRSRASELLTDHTRVVMASRLQGRRVSFSPAAVIQDKLNVLGTLHCTDGLSVTIITFHIVTSPPPPHGRVPSIVMSMSVRLFVCLSVRLQNSKTSPNVLCMLPTVMTQSCCAALRYVMYFRLYTYR